MIMAKDAKWYASWVRLANAQSAEEKLTNLETAEFIENLAAELEAVKRERDAAVEMLRTSPHCCESCKHKPGYGYSCTSVAKMDGSCYEWRGVQEDESDGR